MWERFELFWTAFEKFALFFAFVSTLVLLVAAVYFYDTLANLPPPPPQPDLKPMVHSMEESLNKIQNTVLEQNVSISYTVPITIDIRIDPRTKLDLVNGTSTRTGEITINLKDGAGRLVGQSATLKYGSTSALEVRMNFDERAFADVPIEFQVPIKIPLNSIGLEQELEALRVFSATLAHGGTITSTATENAQK
jgi:hypothetical protein